MSVNFDISVFENKPQYVIKANQADGALIITPAEDRGSFVDLSENDESPLFGTLDIRIIKNMPPILVLTIEYRGPDWVNADYVIAMPRETRYTFEVTSSREKRAGGRDVIERYTIFLTDQSIGLLNDIVKADDPRKINLDVSFRLTGNQIIDGNLTFGINDLKHILDDYTASGSLNNDFSALYDYLFRRKLHWCKERSFTVVLKTRISAILLTDIKRSLTMMLSFNRIQFRH